MIPSHVYTHISCTLVQYVYKLLYLGTFFSRMPALNYFHLVQYFAKCLISGALKCIKLNIHLVHLVQNSVQAIPFPEILSELQEAITRHQAPPQAGKPPLPLVLFDDFSLSTQASSLEDASLLRHSDSCAGSSAHHPRLWATGGGTEEAAGAQEMRAGEGNRQGGTDVSGRKCRRRYSRPCRSQAAPAEKGAHPCAQKVR